MGKIIYRGAPLFITDRRTRSHFELQLSSVVYEKVHSATNEIIRMPENRMQLQNKTSELTNCVITIGYFRNVYLNYISQLFWGFFRWLTKFCVDFREISFYEIVFVVFGFYKICKKSYPFFEGLKMCTLEARMFVERRRSTNFSKLHSRFSWVSACLIERSTVK